MKEQSEYFMRYIFVFIMFFVAVQTASAQSLACSAGRALYAKDYASLFSEYTGTAATVEACAIACGEADPDDRMLCLVGGCGLACLFIGMENCIDYYSEKLNIDSRRDRVEEICQADENTQERDADIAAWSSAQSANTINAYKRYLESCNSICGSKTEAESRLTALYTQQDDDAWGIVKDSGLTTDAQKYLNNCEPTCLYAEDAQIIIDEAQRINDEENARQVQLIKSSSTSVLSIISKVLIVIAMSFGIPIPR